MGVAMRLREFADTSSLEVDFDERFSSTEALEPLIELLPEAEWWSDGIGHGSSGHGDRPSDHLPVRLQSWCMSPDAVGDLLAAVGKSPATVRWDFSGWPEAPDVQTVFVHVKQVEAKGAGWLTAQVGLRVTGNSVMAPW
ncbi:hypothetical protein ACIHFE_20415 [Streptomyces sp. NPDC052396]|uniref:hypothetical protein n=1 Tax=Streptomyces sp. NPDC052396 TaxID=3365689 RepID=UPI0037CCCE8E